MDDSRVGRIARVLRHRLGLRQADVATRAGLSREPITRVERGAIDGLTIRSLRRIFGVFDAEVVVLVRWRGGELDRVVDRRYAALGGQTVGFLESRAWGMTPEVSFSESVRRWLRAPAGSLSGIWFLSDAAGADRSQRTAPRMRIRSASRRRSGQEVQS